MEDEFAHILFLGLGPTPLPVPMPMRGADVRADFTLLVAREALGFVMDNAVVLGHVVFHGLPDVPDMRPLGREKPKALLDMPSLVVGGLEAGLAVAHDVGLRGAEVEQHRQDRAHAFDAVGVKRLANFFRAIERLVVGGCDMQRRLVFWRQRVGKPTLEAVLYVRFKRHRLKWDDDGGKKAPARFVDHVEQELERWLFHRDVPVLKMRPEPDKNGVVIPGLWRLDVDRPLRQAKEDFTGDVALET